MNQFFTRFWPQKLATQLMVVLLLSLLAAQIIGAIILFDEHNMGLQSVKRDQILGRVAAIVRVLNETPPAMHQNILDAASTVQLSFTLSDKNALQNLDDDNRQNSFSRRLALILNQPKDRPIYTEFEDREWTWRGHQEFMKNPHKRRSEEKDDDDEDDDDDHHDDHGDGHAGPYTPPGLNIALQLPNQQWLNARYKIIAPDRSWAYATFLVLGLMALAVCVVSYLMVRRITKPLAVLATASDALGRGEDGPDLNPTGPVEVRTTVHAFNQMRERLHRFVEDRTRMLAAISHDLRSPLTSMRLRTEMIDDPEIRSRILESLIEMQAMTEATLTFARDDANKEPTRPTDMGALVESIALDLQDMGADVSFTPPAPSENLSYRCRLFALKRAIRNVIENAIRYGERARIILSQDKNSLFITIEDDGPGIPSDKLEQVFDPFVRLESSRNLDTGGIGLGLATARNIIHAHGGEITLTNGPEKGLSVQITLPKSPA